MSRMLSFLALGALLLIAGCGGGGTNSGGADPTIFAINGVSDSNQVDFLIDDDVFAPGLAYMEHSTNFQTTASGERDIRMIETGTTNEFWAEVAPLKKNEHYAVVGVGLINYPPGEDEKRAQIAPINVDRIAPNGGKARVYVVHGYNRESPFDTPNIDFQTPGDNPKFKINDIPFAKVKSFTVDADGVTPETYEARRAGTETILAQTTVTLQGGKIYAAVVGGVENGVGQLAPRIEFIELPKK